MKKIIFFSDLREIAMENNIIILQSDNESKKIHINIFKNNIDKIKLILIELKSHINKTYFDEKINNFLSYSKIPKTNSNNLSNNKIRGWLLLLYLTVIAYLLDNVISIFNEILIVIKNSGNVFNILKILVIALFIILEIYLTINFSMKKKRTKDVLKAYRWVFVIYRVFIEFSVLYVGFYPTNIYYTGIAIFRLTGTLLITLFINEYINTSERVKNTLVN